MASLRDALIKNQGTYRIGLKHNQEIIILDYTLAH